MTKKIVFGVAVVALATLVMTPSASAACAGPRTAGTYNFQTSAVTYWTPAGGDPVGTMVGQAWQLGAPATFNSAAGALPCLGALGILYQPALNPGTIGLGADFSTCGSGCPAAGSTLAVLAQNAGGGKTSFLLGTVAETPTGVVNFDFSATGNRTMQRLPKVTVVSSGPRSANSMPMNVTVSAVGAGAFGPGAAASIAGYRLVQALSVGDPGRDAAAYTPVTGGSISAPGGGSGAAPAVTVDCTDPTNTKDAWVAVQLVLEGGAVTSNLVSEPVRVHCAGALADPKYRPVPKGKAVGQTQN